MSCLSDLLYAVKFLEVWRIFVGFVENISIDFLGRVMSCLSNCRFVSRVRPTIQGLCWCSSCCHSLLDSSTSSATIWNSSTTSQHGPLPLWYDDIATEKGIFSFWGCSLTN